jgi:hypothetical protein
VAEWVPFVAPPLANDINAPTDNSENEPESWYRVPRTDHQLRLIDLSRTLISFFSLNWDEWGYLTPKSNCSNWLAIMESAVSFLDEENLVLGFLDSVHKERNGSSPQDWKSPFGHIFDWNLKDRRHSPLKTKELVEFQNILEQLIPEGRKWLMLPIATLYITNATLRASALTLLEPLTYKVEGTSETEAAKTRSEGGEGTQQSDRGSWSSVNSDRWNKTGGMGYCDNFSVSVSDDGEVVLKWRTVTPNGPRGRAIQELEETVNLPGAEARTRVEIPPSDIVVIVAWAVTRSLLWLNSEDSAPLLKFVRNLDRHVWIV